MQFYMYHVAALDTTILSSPIFIIPFDSLKYLKPIMVIIWWDALEYKIQIVVELVVYTVKISYLFISSELSQTIK